MSTIAVLGDVGAHLDKLVEALRSIGVDTEAATIPDGLTVVSVGDLIHKGEDSDAVVALVESFRRNGQRWVQLLGNHEVHHLGGPQFWGVEITAETKATLVDWLASGWAGLAASAETADGQEWLITHAGLCRGTWKDLGSPATAHETAERLNELLHTDPDTAFQPGWMLGGERANEHAGVCWAEPVREVLGSWYGLVPPFNQVHGHASPYDWFRSKWRDPRIPHIVDSAHFDTKLRHTTLRVGGKAIVGIDAGFGRVAYRRLCPFIIDGHMTAAPEEIS